MFNIGPAELLIIGLVLLIAVGPEQLPSVIRRAGSTVAQFRSMTDGLRSEFMAGLDEIERATDIESWSAEDSDVGKGDAATRRSAAKDTSAEADRSADTAPVTGDDAATPAPPPSTEASEVADTLFTDSTPETDAAPAPDSGLAPEPDAAPPSAANGTSDGSEEAAGNSASRADAGEETP